LHKGALELTDARAQLEKIMILLTTAAATSEKAAKRNEACLVSSKVYRLRENYTPLQAWSFLGIGSQHLNFAALTSAPIWHFNSTT
jgi:hypothetical protein